MRIVIKIGTSNITYSTGCLNLRHVEALVKVISDVKNAGNEVILVSSGAIAMGTGKLNLSARPSDIAGKQACAAVGQCELMYTYDRLFGDYNHTVAQLLLTAPDLEQTDRCEKFKATMGKLLDFKALPIINENDTVSTEEIEFGDNDTLAAKVGASIGADVIVLLSDINGLYTADPRRNPEARFIPEVRVIDEKIMALGGGAGTAHGTGGMETKLRAAKIATDAGCDMIIMNGDNPENLYNIIDNTPIGTRFYSNKK
jgi:glutamate 5-kinase